MAESPETSEERDSTPPSKYHGIPTPPADDPLYQQKGWRIVPGVLGRRTALAARGVVEEAEAKRLSGEGEARE